MTLEEALSNLESARFENLQLKAQVAARDHEIDKLHRLLKQAKDNLYGKKSEKLPKDSTQVPLFSFKEEPRKQELEKVSEVKAHTRRTSKPRKPLPDDLEREEVIYDLEDKNCPHCGKEMPALEPEKTEQLEYFPAHYKIIEHIRIKRACPCCKQGVYVAKLPPSVQPLYRSQPGPGLLSYIAVSKFNDHLPLNRLESVFERDRIDIPRQRMCDWMAKSAETLLPLARRVQELITSKHYFQADETSIEVQEDGKPGKLHTGYFWAMLGVGPPSLVAYHYAEGRAGEVPKELFKGKKATIQTDAYAGYNTVFLPNGCRRLACMAHIRRKFIKAQDSAESDCTRVLTIIGALYHIEAKLKGEKPEDRRRIRLKKSFPELKRLYRLVRELKRKTLPESELAKALNYAWEQRREVLRLLKDGSFEIDNNAIERMMRPIAIGRKNYLFAGSHDGARTAAVFYTLINTCRLNKVNPFEYLKDVFVRIHQPGRLDNLLPHNWKPAA